MILEWIGKHIALILVLYLIAMFIWMMTITTPTEYWHAQAIAHNAAHYDATTGRFEWNERVKP